MMGEASNDYEGSFWQADIEEAAQRVATILREEAADLLTVYDDHGGYGHPDHIQVHRVGHRAAEIAGTERVFEATMNRDLVKRWREEMPDDDEPETAASRDDPAMDSIGTPDADITTAVDVAAFIDTKRAGMAAHASQIDEESWFFQLADEVFATAFGTEWFVQVKPPFEADPVADRADWIL